MNTVAKIFATAFGAGYSPVAPGTAGSLVASAVLFSLYHFDISISLLSLIVATIITTIIGVIATDAVEAEWGKDPSKVVIDEVAGILVAVICVPLNPATIIASFVLFRIFDIWKPLGIRKLEDFKGGIGVMADDLLAGVYANIVLQILLYFNLFG